MEFKVINSIEEMEAFPIKESSKLIVSNPSTSMGLNSNKKIFILSKDIINKSSEDYNRKMVLFFDGESFYVKDSSQFVEQPIVENPYTEK